MSEEYKWESARPLRDEVAGRVAAGSGLFIAAGCIAFSLDSVYLGMLFLACAVISGYYFYITSSNTIISISDNILSYGKNTKIVLEGVKDVSVKRQFLLTDVLVLKKKGRVGDVIPLQGVPSDERKRLIEVIQSKISNS